MGRRLLPDIRPAETKAGGQGLRASAAGPVEDARRRPGGEVDIGEIPVEVVVVLGRTTLSLASLMAAGKGERLRLDASFGQPVELQVSGRVIGYGEIVAEPDDSAIGIRLLSIAAMPA